MQEPPSSKSADLRNTRSLFERLSALISPEPENRNELLEILHDAHERNLIDAEALSMIEGVFRIAELSAGDIMIPRAQMDVVDISQPVSQWLPHVLRTAHSRFPAVDGERDKIVGILLAKDLLRYYDENETTLDIRSILRPAVFIPESKHLDSLLRDFRANRNHMAIVVDEYGGISGIVTIEDVLEEIVGDIEDEYDLDDEKDNIQPVKEGDQVRQWRVKALTEIEQLNRTLGTGFSNEEVDTVGGLVVTHLGRMPHQGEACDIDGWRFHVLRADARRVHVLQMEALPETTN